MKEREVINMEHKDSGVITINSSLDTSKPSSALVTKSYDIINDVYTNNNAPIKCNKISTRVILNFDNSAGAADDTIYYSIENNGTVYVDGSSGTTILAGGTLAVTKEFEIDTNDSGTSNVEIYAWAGTTTPTFVSYRIYTGIGTINTSYTNIISILDPVMKNIALDYSEGTAGNMTLQIKDTDGNEILTSTSDINISINKTVNIYGKVNSGEILWIDRIMLIKI